MKSMLRMQPVPMPVGDDVIICLKFGYDDGREENGDGVD